jgi:hypothetical protein
VLSRENRAILGSFLLTGLVFVGVVIAERQFGTTVSGSRLLLFLLYAGLCVCVPQLYLAKTDTTVAPRSRVRFAVLMTLIFAGNLSKNTGQLQDRLIVAVGGGAFLALVGYEFVAGYRDSRAAELRSESSS